MYFWSRKLEVGACGHTFRILISPSAPCADPGNFVRGGPTLTHFLSLMRGGRSKYHYKRAIIGPPAKRHLNDVSLACRWWPNIECFVIFRGSRSVLQRNPIFYDFSGGGGGGGGGGIRTPVPLWIRACARCEIKLIQENCHYRQL